MNQLSISHRVRTLVRALSLLCAISVAVPASQLQAWTLADAAKSVAGYFSPRAAQFVEDNKRAVNITIGVGLAAVTGYALFTYLKAKSVAPKAQEQISQNKEDKQSSNVYSVVPVLNQSQIDENSDEESDEDKQQKEQAIVPEFLPEVDPYYIAQLEAELLHNYIVQQSRIPRLTDYAHNQGSHYQSLQADEELLPYSDIVNVSPVSFQQNNQTYSTFMPGIRHNIQLRSIADIARLPDASPQHTNDMLQTLANVVVTLNNRLETLQSARSCQAIETQRGLTNEIEDIFRCAVEKAATYGDLCSNNKLLESARIFNGWYKGGSEYPNILSSLYQVDALCTIYPAICKNDVSAPEFAQACSKVSQCWQDMVQQAQIAEGMQPRVSYMSRVLYDVIETVKDTFVGAVRSGNRLIKNAQVITTTADCMYISAYKLEKNKSAMASSLTDSQVGMLLPITQAERLIQEDSSDNVEKEQPHNLEQSFYFDQVQSGSPLSANRTAKDLAESFINTANDE